MNKVQYDDLKIGDLITMTERSQARLLIVKKALHYIEVKMIKIDNTTTNPFYEETIFSISRDTIAKIGYYKA